MATSIYEILNDISELTTYQLVQLADVLNVPLDNLARNSVLQPGGVMHFEVDPLRGDNFKKIQMIKAIREQTRMGLKEAKDVIDGVRGLPIIDLNHEEINLIRKYADEFGYIVKIKQD